MFRKLAAAATLALTLAAGAGSATAQQYYGGWNVGPVTDDMMRRALEGNNDLSRRIAERERQTVMAAMQDPTCQRLYRQHQMQGGHSPFPNFAYMCWATRYFTPDGIQTFMQSENANRQAEFAAVVRLRMAEQRRGNAQTDLMTGGHNIGRERGHLLGGNSTYVGPDGRPVVLQHMRPGEVSFDPRTGHRYVMNQSGQYFWITPNGFVPMRPAYGG
jgi:hypothetical protein